MHLGHMERGLYYVRVVPMHLGHMERGLSIF